MSILEVRTFLFNAPRPVKDILHPKLFVKSTSIIDLVTNDTLGPWNCLSFLTC